MGNLFDSEEKTSSIQRTQVPGNFQNLMDSTIDFAFQGLDTPFQSYNAPRIAALSGNEQAGIAAAGAQAGMYQPLINMAMVNNADMQAQGGLPSAGDLQGLINPYVDYVLNNSLNRLNEASDRNMTNIGSMAGMAGAFGGSRHGVLEGANLAELLKSSSELSASTYADAYDKGMSNWFQGQNLRRGTIQDALGIVGGGQAYNSNDINNLMNTGLTERTQKQGILDFAFSEFMREQQDPFTKAGFASDVMAKYPTNLFTRTADSTTTSSPSPFSQIAGIGLAAAGLMTGNPAALAGLGAGQQALMKSSGNLQYMNDNGTPRGYGVIDESMYRSAKGGMIKLKGGGYVKGGPIVKPDDAYRARIAKELADEAKTPDTDHSTPWFDVLDAIFGPTVASGEYPLLGNLTGSDENSVIPNSFYEDTRVDPLNPSRAEKRMEKFLGNHAGRRAGDALTRNTLKKKLTGTQYVAPQDFSGFNREAEEINKYNGQFKYKSDLSLEQFLEEMQRIKELNSVPTDDEFSLGPPTNGGYAKGGKVKAPKEHKYLLGGLLALDYNREGTPESRFYDAQDRFDRQRGRRMVPRQVQPREPFDWQAFIARHGIDQFMSPTAQNTFPSESAPRLPTSTPDLSGFMQRLQNRVAPTGPTPRGPAQGLPMPPGFAKGGTVAFAKGDSVPGSRLKGDMRHDGSVEDITFLLDNIPDEDWAPTDQVFDGMTEPGFDVEDFERGLFKLESATNGWNSLNKDTQAFGKYQFLPSTWNDSIKKLSKQERIDLGLQPVDKDTLKKYKDGDKNLSMVLPSPVQQREVYRRVYLPESLTQLEKNKVAITPQNAYIAHHFGPNAAPGIAKAIANDPNITMEEALAAGGYSPAKIKQVISENNLSNNRGTGGGYFNDISKRGGWMNSKPTSSDLTGTIVANPSGIDPSERAADNWPSYMKHKGAFNELTEDMVRAHMKKTGLRHPADGRRDRIRRGPDLGPTPLSPLETVMGRRLEEPAAGDYLESRGIPAPVTREDLDPLSRFVKGGVNVFPFPDAYAEGGKVKKFDKGGMTGGQKTYHDAINKARKAAGLDPLPEGSWGGTMRDAERELNVRAISAHNDAADLLNQPYQTNTRIGRGIEGATRALGAIVPASGEILARGAQGVVGLGDYLAGPIEGSPYDSLPKESDDLRQLRSGMTGVNIGSPDYGQTQENFTGLEPENLIESVGTGNVDGIIQEPLAQVANSRNQELQDELDSLMLERIRALKGQGEAEDNDPLKSLFGDYNKGLFKMGMSILANSGYPNSAGEAIGKGILSAQESEEAKSIAGVERKNKRLHELLNARYMNAMIEQMSPEQRMAIERMKGEYDIKKQLLKNADSEMKRQADFRRMATQVWLTGQMPSATLGGVKPEVADVFKGFGLPVEVDTSDIEDTDE